MSFRFKAAVAATAVASAVLSAAAPAGIELVGRGAIPGTALDKSGLTGNICSLLVPASCIPQAVLGGLGSAVAYTGHDDVFIAAPDRGPFDGLTDVPFPDRIQYFQMTTNVATGLVSTVLLDTRFLAKGNAPFPGGASVFDRRLDPEGIRVGPEGTFYISDEYGPYILEFNRQGHLVRRIDVPEKFAIANPSADPNTELTGNTSGRQGNRGMEGLAISPDGRTLFGIMQNALLQDHALTPGTIDRAGLNNRILAVDLITGETREYVYVIDAANRGQGVSEILALNDHEFLVVERDNRSWLSAAPQAPTRKTIYRIDLAGATDVSELASLPLSGLPAGVVPATKSLFINLLDPAFGLQNNDAKAIAEKIEGLAWGPDLPDGRRLLYVLSDNDLVLTLPTQIFAFAIDESLLSTPLNYEPQYLPGPLFAPGQVKKAGK